MTRIAVTLGVIALLSFCSIGCSSKPARLKESPDAKNLRLIGQTYNLFVQDKHRAPRNASELKDHFKQLIEKPADPDKVLISPRDGESYVIYYGAPLDADDGGTILAHEKKGAEGSRYVLTVEGIIGKKSDAEFAGSTFASKTNSNYRH